MPRLSTSQTSRSWAFALVALVATGCVGGCGGGDGDTDPSGNTGSSTKSPDFVSVGTGPSGAGAFYSFGSAIAQALNDGKADGGWRQATGEATGGSLENLRRLAKDEIQIGMSNSSISYFAVRGEGGFDEKYDVKCMMTTFPLVACFVTSADSGIETIADLKGKKVVIGPEGAGFQYFVAPILEEHGLKLSDLDVSYAPFSQSAGQLQDGSIDATFLGGALKAGAITSAATSTDIRLIPFDEDARKRVVAKYPSFNEVTVPAGTYKGQDADYAGLNVGSTQLLVRSDSNEDFVYKATKAIYEGREKIGETLAAGRAVNEKNVWKNTGVDFHPGAVKFYEEIGIWPKGDAPKADEPTDENGE